MAYIEKNIAVVHFHAGGLVAVDYLVEIGEHCASAPCGAAVVGVKRNERKQVIFSHAVGIGVIPNAAVHTHLEIAFVPFFAEIQIGIKSVFLQLEGLVDVGFELLFGKAQAFVG